MKIAIPVVALFIVLLVGLTVFMSLRRSSSNKDSSANPRERTRTSEGAFRDVVASRLKARDLIYTFRGDLVDVSHSGSDQPQILTLSNLWKVCSSLPQDQWERTIDEFLNTLNQATQDRPETYDDFDTVRQSLAVSLRPDALLNAQVGASISDHAVCRKDLKGTVTLLVIDLPDSTRSVHPKQLETWKKSPNEIFALGLENVSKQFQPELQKLQVAEGLTYWVFSAEHPYVATHALLLDRFPQCLGKHGSIVAIPTRHILVCVPLDDVRCFVTVNALIPEIVHAVEERPYAISAKLYWKNGPELRPVPYEFDRTKEAGSVDMGLFGEILKDMAKITD